MVSFLIILCLCFRLDNICFRRNPKDKFSKNKEEHTENSVYEVGYLDSQSSKFTNMTVEAYDEKKNDVFISGHRKKNEREETSRRDSHSRGEEKNGTKKYKSDLYSQCDEKRRHNYKPESISQSDYLIGSMSRNTHKRSGPENESYYREFHPNDDASYSRKQNLFDSKSTGYIRSFRRRQR